MNTVTAIGLQEHPAASITNFLRSTLAALTHRSLAWFRRGEIEEGRAFPMDIGGEAAKVRARQFSLLRSVTESGTFNTGRDGIFEA